MDWWSGVRGSDGLWPFASSFLGAALAFSVATYTVRRTNQAQARRDTVAHERSNLVELATTIAMLHLQVMYAYNVIIEAKSLFLRPFSKIDYRSYGEAYMSVNAHANLCADDELRRRVEQYTSKSRETLILAEAGKDSLESLKTKMDDVVAAREAVYQRIRDLEQSLV